MVDVGYSVIRLERDGLSLALHGWELDAPRAVVFYVHGTQSHAGWLFETGPALAARDCAVYALDRRGSGLSEGPRGHVGTFHDWCEDYLEAMALVRARAPGVPMLLLGQSGGGGIAVGVACDPRASHDAVALCAPLIKPRPGFDLWAGRADDEPVRLPSPDTWFTRDPRYLEFIAGDGLMVRSLTRRFQAARLALAEHYLARQAPLASRPSALVIPRRDAMIDLAGAREVYAHLAAATGTVIELPADDHYLEFSSCQAQTWGLVAAFATTVGFTR